MAITRVKTSSILQNFPKERSMLAGNDGDTGAYESIATASVSAGSTQTTIEFTSIPSTFQHLQVRGILRGNTPSQQVQWMVVNMNGSPSVYRHELRGSGSSATSEAGATGWWNLAPAATATSDCYSSFVMDILDYGNTNKYKTLRTLAGWDGNGSGNVQLTSVLLQSSSAISTLTFTVRDGYSFIEDTTFALYGIR